MNEYFCLRHENIFAIPTLHYNMEFAAQVRLAFEQIKPDCVAVELAETMQKELLHAASRLPDLSVVIAHDSRGEPIFYMCEPCDSAFEGLRSALEAQIPAFCIDLDVDYYPEMREFMPDPYAIQRIGLQKYYESYLEANPGYKHVTDANREMHMARRLKELSLSYDRVLFIGGMSHVRDVLKLVKRTQFPDLQAAERDKIELCTLTEEASRDLMAECAWMTRGYEEARKLVPFASPDRQRLIYALYKTAAAKYVESTGNPFPGYNIRNTMKFVRNYALITARLMPDLFQILNASKCCVDHNYAYETWFLATSYPYLRNVDNLPTISPTIEQVWKHSKQIRFHLKQPRRKGLSFHVRHRDKSKIRFQQPLMLLGICSFPREDKVIENFGEFLKKKGRQIITEEAARTIPFSTSLEDGIDIKETLRHWYEHKLFVKARGKPPGGVGSVVVVFDEDAPKEDQAYQEKYPWRMTWLGEHQQESDMAFYGTPPTANIVGPGISRCEYGGFMMSSPPRRMVDVWSDSDYEICRTKSEVLLMAAIDYSTQPNIVYVASKPPRTALKSFAKRFGKKVVYLPIGQLSPITLNKLRVFHVLDGYDKRAIADEFIF